MYQLPLNNSINFTSEYFAYVNIYDLDKVTYITGFQTELKRANGEGIKGQLISNDNINFSPFTVNDSNAFWFKFIGGRYVPQKWAKSSLYQQINNNLLNNFNFEGNLNTNTLSTVYGDNYIYTVFIVAFDGNYNVLSSIYSQPNIVGNFSVSLDTISLSGTIAYLQWGFLMDGYPVYLLETNNQGSVNINNPIPPNPLCFNEGTKILCLNKNLEEEYILIENLRKGDLVKSYKHGYRKIDLIGKNHMINNPNRFNICMYKMEKTEENGLLDDLIVTGGHAILVHNLGEYKEENDKMLRATLMIDDKYLLLSAVSKDFVKLENTNLYTYYHFILENNGNDDERFGVYSNGILTETPSKKQFNNLALEDLKPRLSI